MKFNINCNGLRADDVDVRVVGFRGSRAMENIPYQKHPAVVEDGKLIKQEEIGMKLKEVHRLQYDVEITKNGKRIQFPSMQRLQCVWDNETNPYDFAAEDFKTRPEITII